MLVIQTAPEWFKNWEGIGLIAWQDKNQDGKIQHAPGNAFEPVKPIFTGTVGDQGERSIVNKNNQDNNNEVYIDRDIIVLANPEIANLPPWVIALVAAGALAAALSTAAGLLLVISSAVSHDLIKKTFVTNISEKQELAYARISVFVGCRHCGIIWDIPPRICGSSCRFCFWFGSSNTFPSNTDGYFFKIYEQRGCDYRNAGRAHFYF
ncbi:MAG: hypothetical protein Ct9H300mP6_12450 [Gammaproteobacteria bacterium]|nr:MAG: hypothetical protein Ct9H300mP6_12450 [Gammaproteobacteria bacterium]